MRTVLRAIVRFYRIFLRLSYDAAHAMSEWTGIPEGQTNQEVADLESRERSSAAEVGAAPTDRALARALLRNGEGPGGLPEAWREWSPLDPSTPEVARVRQAFVEQHRLRSRPRRQAVLELRRFPHEASASEAFDAARRLSARRTREGTAVAVLLAWSDSPSAQWDADLDAAMRLVSERLR